MRGSVDGCFPFSVKEITAKLSAWGGYFFLFSYVLWIVAMIEITVATIDIAVITVPTI